MEIILLQKVQNLGDLGDLVDVKPGYGRNYLVPQGMAVPATKENREYFESQREELERASKERIAAAQARKEALEDVVCEIHARASAEGTLYGSVGPQEIAARLTEMGKAVEKSEVLMPDGPIGHGGEYDIDLSLHADVDARVKLIVVAEEDPAA